MTVRIRQKSYSIEERTATVLISVVDSVGDFEVVFSGEVVECKKQKGTIRNVPVGLHPYSIKNGENREEGFFEVKPLINKAYKFRLYPTKAQIKYLEGCFRACRRVYNMSLIREMKLYELGEKSNLTPIGLKYHLKNYKERLPHLKNYDALALEFEMDNLSSAYDKLFKGGGRPKFKKIDDDQSFRTRLNISITEDGIKIPKVDTIIKTVFHRKVEGKPKQMTISKKNDKYYVSIMVEIDKDVPKVPVKTEVGIDVGIAHFITMDNGEKVENPKFLKEHTKQMKKLQQRLARCDKGSNNHIKTKKKIAKLHERIRNKRQLFLHEESHKLVKQYDRIFIEDLNVKGMTASAKGTIESPGKMVKQKSGLNRNLLDVGIGGFFNMLEYKARFSGKEVVKRDRFYASSKICSHCGHKNVNLKLSDREWVCEKCGTKHDRDVNSAKNMKVGTKETKNETSVKKIKAGTKRKKSVETG
jgi:putative transposase